jgi:DNA polymerase III delta subunit
MGTYTQWARSAKIGRVNWVYGPEEALIKEVRQFIKKETAALPLDTYAFDAACDPETEIWDTVYSRSLTDGSFRFIEIINAEKLSDAPRLTDWLAKYSKYSPETVLLLVANEESDNKAMKTPRAVVIKCVMAKLEHKLSWVSSIGNLSDSTAKRLLEYKNGNLLATYDVCKKIKTLLPEMTDIELNIDTIQSLDEETPVEFSQALLERDKNSAIKAISTIQASSVGAVLSYLDYSLGLIEKLKEIPANSKLDAGTNIPMYRISSLLPVFKRYSYTDLVRNHQVLAYLESYYRQGISEGILEVLVLMW